MRDPLAVPPPVFRMPRRARVIVPSMAHHVVQRGSRRLNVFRDESDRHFYLNLFRESCDMYGLAIRAYSLMPNHVHYVGVPELDDSVAKTFHRAQGMYSKWFNEKHGYVGHLWQERPFSCVLSEAHTRNAIRYVENNPVRAGMVSSAKDFRWSSARAHCFGEPDALLDPGEPRAIEGWSEWLRGDVDTKIANLIRECTVTGRPCGDDLFVEQLEQLTGRKLRPKKPGPKPKVTDGALLAFGRDNPEFR
jgi:putative transposase